jgi:PAS domain S-box-containing protein
VAAALIVTVSALRFQMFGLVPLARSLLIERLDTGMLVLDARDRIIDINPAAQRMLGVGPEATGKRLTEILADGDVWLRTLHGVTTTPTTLERDGVFYDVQAVLLRNRRGRLLGQLVALHDITPHKRAEATLREAEERLRAFVDCAPIGISVNRGGRALYVNPAYARMYGYDSAEELAGTSLLDHVAPEYRAEIRARLEARERGEAAPGNYEALGQRKDGSIFAYHVEVAHIRLPDGMANLAFHLDITALRQAEEALHQAQIAERNQRILAEALRDSAAAINETLDVEAVLDRILENVGRVVPHQAADILLIEGQTARLVSWRGRCNARSDDLRARVFPLDMPTLHWMIDTGHYCLIPDILTDDRWTPVPQVDWIRSYLGAPIETRTQIIGFLSLVSDTPGFFTLQHAGLLQAFADQAAIALEKAQLFDMVRQYSTQLEQLVTARTAELEHERAQFKAILDALADGVLHDDFNRVMYVNPAFTRLTGYTAEEVIDQPLNFFSTLFAPEFVRFPGAISETIRRGDSWHGEIRARIKEGRTAQFEATFTALTDPQGQPISKVGIFRDVTPEKTWQAQKTRFINHAAHELRTPLTNLKTRLYLLRRQPDRLDNHLAVMEPVVDQMAALVEELLEMSRLAASPAALKRQIVPLQTVLAESVALMRYRAEQRGVRLLQTISDAPLPIFADVMTLERAITRLIANAISATPPGGQVELAAQPDERAVHALLRIYDGGDHLPPDQLRQIFEPFFRATQGDTQGTGLSLSIARQIVELHSGDIAAANAPERGLVVEARLPLVNR